MGPLSRVTLMRHALIALLALAIAGCAGPLVPPPPTDEGIGPRKDVWVVRHGWHTRIAVRLEDVDSRLWPESQAFGEAAYLEVGWGDRDFYPSPRPSVWDAVDPVVRATPAALHVGALPASPGELFGRDDVIRLSVPAVGMERLARFIHEHYVHDAAGMPVRIRHGYYPLSAFYEARGRYHALTYNSNTWTVSALRAAGVPVDPASVVTSGAVMQQAAAAGAPRHD